MKSPRGFAAAVLFLSALPLAALCEGLAGGGGATVIHVCIALGSGLLCAALPEFRTPRWATWLGRLTTGALAIIFALQATAELTRNPFLTEVAFQRLGQHLEGWLLTGFLIWCLVAALLDGRGKIRLLGLVAISLALAARGYATMLPLSGATLESTAPALKLVYLLPFIWLVAESRKRSFQAGEADRVFTAAV